MALFQNLSDCKNLQKEDIFELFEKAKNFKNNKIELENNSSFTRTHELGTAMCFFEASTRTKMSFETALINLQTKYINFDTQNSSLKKGESLIDTVENIASMGYKIFIIRHTSSGVFHYLCENMPNYSFINAGDGKHKHPSQGLLDAFTLWEKYGDELSNKKICIVGDLLHSRVAKSNIEILTKLGVQISTCGPNTLSLHGELYKHLVKYKNINDAVENNDIIMELRIQNERLESAMMANEAEFHKYYGLKSKHLNFKKNLIFMHPGPVNYGVEIAKNLINHPNSLILKQVANGVYIRMAILDTIINFHKSKI